MDDDIYVSLIRIAYAIMAGGLIGLERSYNGRPAGFRTHALVCTASSLLMLLTVFQWKALSGTAPLDTIRVDPTRMAQGIMTGIGFLGAGVIMKEKLSVRGLTTAASIWITASIGIVIGMGLYQIAAIGIAVTIGALSLFRWLEQQLPNRRYGILNIQFSKSEYLSDLELKETFGRFDIGMHNCSYHQREGGKSIRYEITLITKKEENFRRLALHFNEIPIIKEYSIIPIGN